MLRSVLLFCLPEEQNLGIQRLEVCHKAPSKVKDKLLYLMSPITKKKAQSLIIFPGSQSSIFHTLWYCFNLHTTWHVRLQALRRSQSTKHSAPGLGWAASGSAVEPWVNRFMHTIYVYYSCILFISLGFKITANGDCSHEIKRRLLLGRKVLTNLDNILKSKGFTLPTQVCLVKAMVFPVVMYGCESWTIKKAEHQRIDAFELWCWRRLLRVPWTARKSN